MIMREEGPFIYLDNAATAPMPGEVREAMEPYLNEKYGNPSAVYRFAGESMKAVRHSRDIIAGVIGALPEEIYFTSGGTESDNWALFSVCEARGFTDCHIITTQIEHHAIINTCKRLERLGVKVTYLPVSPDGLVDLEDVQKAILPDTVLISVMMANNEIGTIEPVNEIGKIAREQNILFHTDAVQAFGHIPVDVTGMNVDLLSASAHKIGGPKGIGFMYVRKGLDIYPFMHGGRQERGRRSGTLNVPGIAGFGAAAEIAGRNLEEDARYVSSLRDHMISRICAEIPDAKLNGDLSKRLPGNVSFCFKGMESETMVILLDRAGICASGGSACSSGATEPSHVLLAIGRTVDEANGSLRFSMDKQNTIEEIDHTVDTIKTIINEHRI